MIILKTLTWDNAFSYGKGNVVKFDENPITQLIGKNGHGKSSIALILEEVIFNKNSKGIKKADIINRHISDKAYKIGLTFSKDGDEYEIQTTRGSTQTVVLMKNGDNISGHTATTTFKMIEDIFGIEHKAFSQYVYQSSAGSLEFLTATDSNRKKFLIDLLNLDKYTQAFEVFKAAAKEVATEVSKIEGSISATKLWIDKNQSIVGQPKKDLLSIPVYDDSPVEEVAELNAKVSSIADTNKRITKNNQYRVNLAAIDTSKIRSGYQKPEDTTTLVQESATHYKVIKDADAFIKKVAHLNGMCPTCLQPVNRTKLDELIAEQETIKTEASAAIEKIDVLLAANAKIKKKYDEAQKLKTEYEQYHSLIDDSIPSDPLDSESLEARISYLKKVIKDRSTEIEEIERHNSTANTHNSKLEIVKSQMVSMQEELANYTASLETMGEKLSRLQVLQKTFSTSGLVAYKIECMVKDLEELTNEYLGELSSGRFQISFVVSSSDKLNVVICDNGRDIDISALSSGEKARVNTATLLAIRKLMQSLSNARINLLILDETIENLDAEGKEKLVEVLLQEEHLNTFLVSHGFSHPLLEKVSVIKENNISRLE